MIQNMMNEGKIVPSEVTVKLLQKAMLESGNNKFLIDGFPRNEENRVAFEAVVSLLHHLFISVISLSNNIKGSKVVAVANNESRNCFSFNCQHSSGCRPRLSQDLFFSSIALKKS